MKGIIPEPVKSWAKNRGPRMPRRGLKSKIEGRFFPFVFEAQLKRTTPVFVYQMGKVASSTIYYSLMDGYSGTVLHSHSFRPDQDEWRIRKLFEQTIGEKKPLDVISLTREPISRNISAFFQNFERDTGTEYSEHEFSMMHLRELFLTNYDHDIPLVWFDKNIKANFGIDVYATPFPQCGIELYKKDHIRLLVMRSEIDDELKITAIKDFLELPEFELIQRNIGAQKEYAAEYRQFVESTKLPAAYIAKMVNSKYFDHFYDSNFAQAVQQRWSP